jgi:hypothetical protein
MVAIALAFSASLLACGSEAGEPLSELEARISELERELATAPSTTLSQTPAPTTASSLSDAENDSPLPGRTLEDIDYTTGFADGFVVGFSVGLNDDSSEPSAGNHVMTPTSYELGWDYGYLRGLAAGTSYRSVSQAANDSTSPTTPVAVATGPTDQWCAEYRLALEVNGDNKARSITNPLTGEAIYSGMNRGMYEEWVVAPLYEVGCPIPPGYSSPDG